MTIFGGTGMEASDRGLESLEAFKDSFTSTGSRSNLNFKFLKNLTTEEAGNFFQELLWKIGQSIDDGDFIRILEHVVLWQVEAYDRLGKWAYEHGPFTPLQKPLSESRLALIASSGHFVEGMDPEPFGVKGMTQAEAVQRIGDFLKEEPDLSIIPKDTPLEKLRVRHGGYDIHGACADPDVAFPLRRLKELERLRAFGELNDEAYSFVGAASQMRILNHAGPRWVARLKEQDIDVALMVPL
jgi:D-proline reductase (dithiol) PrdB